MNLNIILALTSDQLVWMLLSAFVLPIFALIVVALVVKFSKITKTNVKLTVPDDQNELFEETYGGKDNIIEVNKELNRVSVMLQDVEKVDLEKLKELGADGILVAGNTIKCSFKERSENIYQILLSIKGKDK
ncbi:MAG: hypothetical protein PHT83_06240 [Bacilli bacterium]|nr:hypothetical protein [Bacilli bacterium]